MDQNLIVKANILGMIRGQTWPVDGLAALFNMPVEVMLSELAWLAENGFVSMTVTGEVIAS